MSVIEDVISGLDSLKSNNPAKVVDMLVRIHESGLPGIQNPQAAVDALSKKLLKNLETGAGLLPDKEPEHEHFPDFSAEQSRTASVAKLTTEAPQSSRSISIALEGILTSYQELLENYNRDFEEIQSRRREGASESDDEVIKRLQAVQLLLLKYPIAGQALYAALIREGRAYAQTDKGAKLKRQLENSPTVAKARTLFEGVTGGMLAETNSDLPSTFVEGFVEALDRDLEVVLSELGDVEDVL